MVLFAWNQKESWAPLVQALDGKRARHRGLINILPTIYEGVLAYHGCRPADVNSYYTAGLLRSNSAALDIRAHEIFSSGEFPEITSAQVESAIAGLGARDNGSIFAGLDRDHLLAHCGHYMIYGSERLCAIAAALGDDRTRDYRQILKRYGKPTLFHVALRWEQMTESDVEALARITSENLSKIRQQKRLSIAFTAFELYDLLPGSAILTHEHPDRIVDPLLGMTLYEFRKEVHHAL